MWYICKAGLVVGWRLAALFIARHCATACFLWR
jgi:hypothetical protein